MNGLQENQQSMSVPNAIVPIGTAREKRCCRCKETKPLSSFSVGKSCRDGLQRTCKDCNAVYAKKYYDTHKKYESERHKKAYLIDDNRLHILIRSKEYRDVNKDKCRGYARKKQQKRRSTPEGKLNLAMSCQICQSIVKGEKAGRRWWSLVDYTPEQLKKHLEKRFTPEMAWNNYGTYWQIDHIIPKAAFNFTTAEDIDFKRCWALKNLQPLHAKENNRKGDALDKPFQPSLCL